MEYISNNLDEKISISELAQIANLSKYHFHRVMRSLLGEPIGNYIIRIRVETAALLIRYTNIEIKNIASRVGYETASSLNKIFKQYYNISPTEYRKNKTLKINNIVSQPNNFKLKNPKIIKILNKDVIYVEIRGEYGRENFNKVWTELNSFVSKNRLSYKESESFGISYDDPSVTKKENCRYEACFTIKQSIKPKGNIGVKTIKGGEFAVFSFRGTSNNWGSVYDYIFDQWLINSPYELRNEPVMEKYLTNAKNNVNELNLEIYLPIKTHKQ